MLEDHKHYLAGVIDGDGSLNAYIRGNKIEYEVHISSVHEWYLIKLQKLLGNYNSYIRTYIRKKPTLWKQEYKLTLNRKDYNTLNFLKEIQDYLILKRSRAKILQHIILKKNIINNVKKLQKYNKLNIYKSDTNHTYNPQYFAGLLDSEGCICIYKRKNRENSYHCTLYPLSTTSRNFVNHIKKTLPYNIYIEKRDRRDKHPATKISYNVLLHTQNFIDYINDIYPYLILKKSNMDAFKQFRLGIDKENNHIKLKKLNKRGIDDVSIIPQTYTSQTYIIPAISNVTLST